MTISDAMLVSTASKVISRDEYLDIREKYVIRNPKRYTNANAHRRIMESAIKIAKAVIGNSGTEEEIKQACLYMQICIDARQYNLDWNKARKDCKIEDISRKYA